MVGKLPLWPDRVRKAEQGDCVPVSVKWGSWHLPTVGLLIQLNFGLVSGRIQTQVRDSRILSPDPHASPPSPSDWLAPYSFFNLELLQPPAAVSLCTPTGHLLMPASTPGPGAGLLLAGEQRSGLEVAGDNPPTMLVLAQSGWLLGTDCCLSLLREERLPVSGLQQDASLARGPEFLAGARCCWAATLATSLGWKLCRPTASGWTPWLVPGVGPSPGGCTLFSSGKHGQMLSI